VCNQYDIRECLPYTVAVATGKCFRTIILMSDAKHAVLALRRMHHAGRVGTFHHVYFASQNTIQLTLQLMTAARMLYVTNLTPGRVSATLRAGRVKICGKKPALVFSRGVAEDVVGL
jgi:hypothetical protein